MSTSFISHRSPDGSRAFAVLSLTALRSTTPQQIAALHEMGIRSLSDLLHFDAIHRARLLEAVVRQRVAHDFDLRTILRDADAERPPAELLDSSTEVIDGVGPTTAGLLSDAFGVMTVAQLASFPPFVEAEALMRGQADAFGEPASAPDELIPTGAGAVVSTHRYSSFVLDGPLPRGGFTMVVSPGDDSDERLDEAFSPPERGELMVGYMLRHTQEWLSLGPRLGEVVHSLGLAPGESRNVAVVDWKRSLLARRDEATTTAEELNSLLVHTRALDEVTRAVAEEHQSGRTSTASASGVTAGGAVAAGALIGAIGGAVVGGATGAVAGLTLDTATLGLDLGTGTITGTVVGSLAGSAVGAAAGAAAGSLIFSGAGALGFIESDSRGDRTVGGELSQNIMDVTAQKSSAVRSLRSTIVVEDNQSEHASATTYNVTNYNHAHALTVQYYELLQRYRVMLKADAVEPFIIIPFRPLKFRVNLISDYWHILRRAVPEAIRTPIDNIIDAKGVLEDPDRPLSQTSSTRLTYIRVRLSFPTTGLGTPPVITVKVRNATDPELEYINFSPDNPFDPDDANVIIAEKSFSGNSGPRLSAISSIKVEAVGISDPNTNFRMRVEQAEFSDVSGNSTTLPEKSLGTRTGGGAGTLLLEFPYNPAADLQQAEQPASAELILVTKLSQYITQRKYLFTRLLLSGIEAEQVSDILERLVLQAEEAPYSISLRRLIDTIPLGFTSAGIVCRIRSSGRRRRRRTLPTSRRALVAFNPEEEEPEEEPVDLTGEDPTPIGEEDPPPDNTEDPPPDDAAEETHFDSEATKGIWKERIDAILTCGDDIYDWFDSAHRRLTRTREINLPTSGLFTEAVLGRSNSAEKIDLTRFINWQDLPIPNAAPAVVPPDTESRVEPTAGLTVTNTEGVLNLLPPTALPDPTGLAGALAAVQNGNMFRDMSQAAVLGSILTNLAGVAERTAIAAGQLSGDALASTLQSANALASKVAEGTQSLANSAFKSMTQLGGEMNQPTPPPRAPNPPPGGQSQLPPSQPTQPTQPQQPQPTDPPPAPSQTLRDVEIWLRVFVESEIWEPAPGLFGAGDLALSAFRFNGDNRSFSRDPHATSRVDVPIKLKFDTATMRATELDPGRAFFGLAEVYLATDTEDVPNQAEWFERKKQGTQPITGMSRRLQPDGKNIKVEQRAQGDSLVVSIQIAAKPQFPFLSTFDTAFAEGIPINIRGQDFPLKFVLDTLIEAVRSVGGSFDLDANFQITFTRRPDGEIQYQVSGAHDGFPAYELYVNGEAAYTFMPTDDNAPIALASPEEVSVAERIPPEKQTRVLRRL